MEGLTAIGFGPTYYLPTPHFIGSPNQVKPIALALLYSKVASLSIVSLKKISPILPLLTITQLARSLLHGLPAPHQLVTRELPLNEHPFFWLNGSDQTNPPSPNHESTKTNRAPPRPFIQSSIDTQLQNHSTQEGVKLCSLWVTIDTGKLRDVKNQYVRRARVDHATTILHR